MHGGLVLDWFDIQRTSNNEGRHAAGTHNEAKSNSEDDSDIEWGEIKWLIRTGWDEFELVGVSPI